MYRNDSFNNLAVFIYTMYSYILCTTQRNIIVVATRISINFFIQEVKHGGGLGGVEEDLGGIKI